LEIKPPEQLQVPRELLNPVDLATPLHLDGHRRAHAVAAQQVDRPDRGRVLAADQRVPLAEHARCRGQQLLKVRLHAVLDQAGVDPEMVR
jgi:hypothetical protein